MKNRIYILSTLLLLGCGQQMVQQQNMLTIDPKGNAYQPGTCNFLGMMCDPLDTNDIRHSEALNHHIEKLLSLPSNHHCNNLDKKNNECQKIKGFVVYIHGGLNTPNNHVDKANELVPIIESTGYKPIFIDWRSGLITTYSEHLFFDRQGEYWPIAGPLTSPFVFITDIGKGVYRLPIDIWELFSNFNKSNIFKSDQMPSEANAAKITGFFEKICNKNPDEITKDDFDGFKELPCLYDNRNIKEKTYDVSTSALQSIISTSTLPLFDSIGSGAWKTMKRRTETLFIKDKPHYSLINDILDFNKETNSYDSIRSYKEHRKGDLITFFEALQKIQKERDKKLEAEPTKEPIDIILVGHSMGTIVANKAISLFPDIKYSKIIYMAAACSLSDYRSFILPYLRNKPETNFYNYTLHPISENTEAHGGGIAGTGSLLVQIDNMYENPASEDQRTLGRWSNMMNGINYFDNGKNDFDVSGKPVRERISLRTFPLGCGFPQQHGDFDDYTFVHTHGRFWLGNLGSALDQASVLCKN